MSGIGALPLWAHAHGSAVVDPASLPLDGYWPRGACDFTGNPFTIGVTATWRGGASAGPSAGRDATRFLSNLPVPPSGVAAPPPPPDVIGTYPRFLAAALSLFNGGALTSLMSTFWAPAALTGLCTFKFETDPSNVGILANNSAIISDAAKAIIVVAKRTAAGVFDAYVSLDGGTSTVQLVGLAVGTWYALGWTYDGATLRVYLDGAPAGLVASPAPVLTSTPIIGTNSSGTDARIGMAGLGKFVATSIEMAGVYAWLLANGGLVD